MKKLASVYAIFMGISMLGMWIIFYLSDSIPELATKPIEIGLHLLAEFSTAILLIVGGIGYLRSKSWGRDIYLLSMGMLIYTVIVSPGYFIQRGQIEFGYMFATFMILALISVIYVIQNKVFQVGGSAPGANTSHNNSQNGRP